MSSLSYPAIPQFETPNLAGTPAGGALALTQFACVLGIVVLLVRPLGWFVTLPSVAVIWSTALILFALAIAGFRAAGNSGQNPWIHPVSLFPIYFAIRYGWGALVMLYWDRLPWQAVPQLRSRFEAFGMRDNLESTCQILLLGGLAFFLGLSLPVGGIAKLLPRAAWRIDERRFETNLILYTPVALFITIVLRYALPLSLQHIVSTFGWVVTALIILASYWMISAPTRWERAKWLQYLVLAVAGAEIVGLKTGMVQEFVYPLLAMLWGYVLVHRRLPWKVLALIVPPVAIFLMPWVTVYKNIAPLSTSMPIGERVTESIARMRLLNYRAGAEMAVDRFVARASGPPLATVFSQFYPKAYPFAMGRTFGLEMMSLVPRILWPGKPEVPTELNRYSAGIGMVRDGDGTSATFDAPSEYYLNFGMAGVLVFFLLHGIYLKVLYEWLVLRSHYLIGASIFAVLTFLNLDFFGVVQLLTAHLHLIPVWLLVFYLLSRDTGRRFAT